MAANSTTSLPSSEQLLAIIRIQTEIAKLGLDLGEVMDFVVERALDLIQADGAAIELAEDEDMVYRAVSGMAKGQLGLRLKLSSSLSGLCALSGHIQNCTDTESDPRVDRAACRRIGVRSMLATPLKYADTTVGVLKVMSHAINAFSQQDEAVLELLAEVLGADMFFAAKYAADDLFHRATHDEMTGLANRALFFDRLRNALSQAARDGHELGVLMIDMDGLKAINDQHGHRVGDAAICELARRASQALRKTDTIARLGGDEFAVILQPSEGMAFLEAGVSRLEQAICQPYQYDSLPLDLGASIGSALYPRDGSDLTTLLDCADKAMYEVKRRRKT